MVLVEGLYFNHFLLLFNFLFEQITKLVIVQPLIKTQECKSQQEKWQEKKSIEAATILKILHMTHILRRI